MYWRKFALFLVLVSTVLALIPSTPISAQENDTLTATVTVNNLNVRYSPSRREGEASVLGKLQQGDIVIVQKIETIDTRFSMKLPWVYVTQPETGLTGWVYSQYLYFSRADWQDVLPQVTELEELSREEGRIHQPFTARMGGGALEYINVRAEPYYGAPKLGYFLDDEIVEVVGTSLINGQIIYVYARQLPENGTLEGWIWIEAVVTTIWTPTEDWAYELPVLQETDVRHLPQAVTNNIRYYNLNVRSAPSLDAPKVAYIWRNNTRLYVHGRTNHSGDGWVYVTIDDGSLRTGISGWIFDPVNERQYIVYADGVTRESLPLITQ